MKKSLIKMIKEKHKWLLEELKELKKKGLIKQPRKRTGKGYANFPKGTWTGG